MKVQQKQTNAQNRFESDLVNFKLEDIQIKTDNFLKEQKRPDLTDCTVNIAIQIIHQEMWIKKVSAYIQTNMRKNGISPSEGDYHIGDFVHFQQVAVDVQTGRLLSKLEITENIKGQRIYKNSVNIYEQFQTKYAYLNDDYDMKKIVEFMQFIQ